MARGNRAPSQHAYRGALGKTQTTTLHVTSPRGEMIAAQAYTTIDAVTDPELVERLYAETLNVATSAGGETIKVAAPVVFHDPADEVLVLVLADAFRHRELDERIGVYERMRGDEAPIPAYAKEFGVVYGGAGLRAYLERRAQDARDRARAETAEKDLAAREEALDRKSRELDVRTTDLDHRATELDRRTTELERRSRELDATAAELERRVRDLTEAEAEIERSRAELRSRVIAAVAQPASGAVTAPALLPEIDLDEEMTSVGDRPSRSELEPRPALLDDLDEIEASLRAMSEPAPGTEGAEESAEDAVEEAVDVPGDVHAAVNGMHAEPPAAIELDEETTGSSIIPPGADPLTTETIEQPLDVVTDPWLDKVAARDTSTIAVDAQGHVRIALVAGEQLARGLGGNLDVRVLLHRTDAYPIVTLVIGPPAALRVTSTTQLAVIVVDIAAEAQRAVLTSLARTFEITLDLIVRGRRIRRVQLVAPLGDNIGYILRAADDHLRGLASASGEGGEPSFERGRDLVLGAGFDLLGAEHPETTEFRDDKLAQLETAQHLRRAIAMARRFARPSREDYLVCTRGFPLPRWRELRRHVLQSAVAWGLWMGPELAQVAVSEGLARSRRDLMLRLDKGFETLKRHPTAFDIDQEAAEDNAKALAEEARALGVELPSLARTNGSHAGPLPSRAARDASGAGPSPRAGREGAGAGPSPDPAPATNGRKGATITSEDVSQASGSIGQTPPSGVLKLKSIEELIADLDDRTQRVPAALELCERGDARAAGPVINAVTKMSRAEAVRVLGMAVKLGPAAEKPLMQGLESSKGFLRHGCALALALLRTEDGTQAVIDLLLNEPTEIWREVARAIGQTGPTGLMPLAANFGRLGERATPQAAERVAWAMAHIAVRGGKGAVEVMASGQSVVAPVAKQALELHASAARDQVRVRPGADGSQAGRDVTVNRAFSRRFFEALEQGLPDVAQAGLEALDASSPMELLDEADLIDDEEAELDESDLIQS